MLLGIWSYYVLLFYVTAVAMRRESYTSMRYFFNHIAHGSFLPFTRWLSNLWKEVVSMASITMDIAMQSTCTTTARKIHII